MGKETPPPQDRGKTAETARAARLKAALKANIAKRKAQARAREAGEDGNDKEKS